MSELSKCCGATIYKTKVGYGMFPFIKYITVYWCSKCDKSTTKIKEKDKPQDTALYASLRR